MLGKVSRGLIAASLLAALAGCNTSEKPLDGTVTPATTEVTPPPGTPVVEGSCPQVFLRDGTAYLRTYAKGGNNDPTKVVFQASLAETSRSCTMTESNLVIKVVAQGRLVTGPMGQAGALTMPIRVAVTDGTATLFSELVQFKAEIPPGSSSTQFVFTKDNIAIPGGAGKLAKVYLGFDEGPAAKP